MRNRVSRSITALGGAAILALGGTLLSTPAAQADVATPAHCGDGWLLLNGEGYAVTKGAYHLKRGGPYADCANVTSLPKGKKLYLQCSVKNTYGNTWYFVREQGTDTTGWISADSVTVYHGDDDGDGSYEPATCYMF
jgi:hypothetical protein